MLVYQRVTQNVAPEKHMKQGVFRAQILWKHEISINIWPLIAKLKNYKSSESVKHWDSTTLTF